MGGYIKFNPQKTKRDNPIKGYAVSSTFIHKTTLDKIERIYNEKCPVSIIQFHKDKIREHTSQKPVALFEYLIKTYTSVGDVVLDNTIGSGTTAVAAINTGRNFIGIEMDKGYCDIANKRIQEAREKLASKLPL